MFVESLPSGFDHPRLEVVETSSTLEFLQTQPSIYVRKTQATFVTILHHQVKAVFFGDAL